MHQQKTHVFMCPNSPYTLQAQQGSCCEPLHQVRHLLTKSDACWPPSNQVWHLLTAITSKSQTPVDCHYIKSDTCWLASHQVRHLLSAITSISQTSLHCYHTSWLPLLHVRRLLSAITSCHRPLSTAITLGWTRVDCKLLLLYVQHLLPAIETSDTHRCHYFTSDTRWPSFQLLITLTL